MDEALNLIQKTVDINAIPAAMKRDGCKRTAGIPTIACLQIMEDIALASLEEEVYIKRYVPWEISKFGGLTSTGDFGNRFGLISPSCVSTRDNRWN